MAVWRRGQAHLSAEMRAALATKLLQREGDNRRILLEEGAGVTEALKAIRGPLFALFFAAGGRGGFCQAGLQAATEMGASPEKIIEAPPIETQHAA